MSQFELGCFQRLMSQSELGLFGPYQIDAGSVRVLPSLSSFVKIPYLSPILTLNSCHLPYLFPHLRLQSKIDLMSLWCIALHSYV